jgi:mandelamide amidase
MPAHFCGIAGLRPSNPKADKPYPVDGIVPLILALDIPGPLARNVADIAFVHTAITHGPELAPVDLRGARIGIPRAYYWETLGACPSIRDHRFLGEFDSVKAAIRSRTFHC